MRKFSSQLRLGALAVLLAIAASGCEQIGAVKAKVAFRDANVHYQRQQYQEAAAKYEEAIAANPDLGEAFFYLGNSYDNQYRPARRGEPANDQLMEKAISNYKIAFERSENPVVRLRSLQFLVNAYGAEKLNDPSQQEPILKQMIELDPSEPGNYFVLANVYEQNGDYDQAEQLLLKAREVKPSDPAVYTTLAQYYNRQGNFDKTMEALHARAEQEPNNPEAHHTIAAYYWEKAYRDFTVPVADKMRYIQEGHKAIDKALALKADYVEAIYHKNLLYRAQALLEKDPKVQQQLLNDAKKLEAQAEQTKNKQRASGAGD